MNIGAKIRQRRDELGWSQTELSKRVNVSQAAINKIEHGHTVKSRYLPEILAALGLPQPAMPQGPSRNDETWTSDLTPVSPPGRLVPIKVSGRAKAGEWIAVDDLGDWEEPEVVYGTRDERFPDARHLAFAVDGDSMNDLKPAPIPDGARVTALAYEDISESVPIRDGMVVVVQRERHSGLEREWSVKQLEIYDDRIEFHPRSTNKRHKPIVVKRDNNADDGTKVEIIALVRDWTMKLSW